MTNRRYTTKNHSEIKLHEHCNIYFLISQKSDCVAQLVGRLHIVLIIVTAVHV